MLTRVRKSRAFTLVEILIVVVILGILAAIVIPQFTKASEDAQIGNVVTQLQTIRSQIELFRVKNNGQYPDFTKTPAWTDLIGPDYLKVAPVNPRTNSSTVGTGATDGWTWDDATKTLSAVGFDETTKTWTN